MDFKDLLDYCKAQAILHTLEGSELSVWRSICRSYSQKFATPLHMCLNGEIPMEDIILAEFEDQLKEFDEEKDLDSVLDKIYALEDPEYEKAKADELEEFIDKAEAEEEERLKKGKPIHPSMKNEPSLKNTSEEPLKVEEKKPTRGGIDLSYMEKEENPHGQFEG